MNGMSKKIKLFLVEFQECLVNLNEEIPHSRLFIPINSYHLKISHF